MPGRSAKPSLFIPIEPDGREESVLFRRYQFGIDINGSRFVLLDRATGAEVWQTAVPRRVNGTPMTYRSRAGRQFVVVATGSGEDAALVAFAIGGGSS